MTSDNTTRSVLLLRTYYLKKQEEHPAIVPADPAHIIDQSFYSLQNPLRRLRLVISWKNGHSIHEEKRTHEKCFMRTAINKCSVTCMHGRIITALILIAGKLLTKEIMEQEKHLNPGTHK